MNLRLKDKTAIVIGAGQTPGDTMGNGRAISILFAREGAKVLLVDINQDSAEETRQIINKENGIAEVVQADITKEDDCRQIVEKGKAHFGKIDILVYVVGIGEGGMGSLERSGELWDSIFNLNLKGLFTICKYVIPAMEDQGGGSIVNISSTAAVCTTSMHAYKASKAGMNALTQSLAMQYAYQGVRVNAIMPGLMNTPIAIEGQSAALGIDKAELVKLRDRFVPLKGGMGSAWDTAYATLFLASDEARHITATILPVDGGFSAQSGINYKMIFPES